MAKTLKEKVKEKTKGEVILDVTKEEFIETLNESLKIAPKMGINLIKDFISASNKKIIMIKELPWMEDHEITFSFSDTVSKLISMLKVIPESETVTFKIKDNYLIIETEKRTMKFKLGKKEILQTINDLYEADAYNIINGKIGANPYIDINSEKFNEILKLSSAIGAEIIRFNRKGDTFSINFLTNDSSDEELSSILYTEEGLKIEQYNEKKLEGIDTFAFSLEFLHGMVPADYEFYFMDEAMGIFKSYELRYAVAKRIEE